MTAPRLYLVTDRRATRGRDLVDVVAAAVRGGVDAVQLREKDLDGGALYAMGCRLADVCATAKAKLLINDRLDVALAVGADGVHLPAPGLPIGEVRAVWSSVPPALRGCRESRLTLKDVIPAKEIVGKFVQHPGTSFRRKPESQDFKKLGIPASAGMTAEGRLSTVSNAAIQDFEVMDPGFRRDDGRCAHVDTLSGGEGLQRASTATARSSPGFPPFSPGEALVARSTHSAAEVAAAAQDGADFAVFGPIFDTPSKRTFGAPQGLAALTEITRMSSVPIVAIGGIDPGNADDVVRSGAAGIAVVRSILGADDPERAATQLRSIVDRVRSDG